jgi:hypothetical protein
MLIIMQNYGIDITKISQSSQTFVTRLIATHNIMLDITLAMTLIYIIIRYSVGELFASVLCRRCCKSKKDNNQKSSLIFEGK